MQLSSHSCQAQHITDKHFLDDTFVKQLPACTDLSSSILRRQALMSSCVITPGPHERLTQTDSGLMTSTNAHSLS